MFFALWPDEGLRHAIGNLVVSLPMSRGAWVVRPERFHLTVVFLGDFDPLSDTVLAAIRSAAAAVRTEGFALSLDRYDSFAGSRVGWLGPHSVPRALSDLHDALDAGMKSAGVPLNSSTPFVPHITIQRNVRTSAPAMDLPPIEWKVREFVLITSMPGSPEPYRIVGTWPLATH